MRFVSVVTSTRSPPRGPLADLFQEIVDLSSNRPDLQHRIDEPGRADDLLDDDASRFLQLVGTGRGRHEDDLVGARLPFLKVERPVVERRRQPEAVGNQHFLSRPVAVVHAPDLRHRLMALVHDEQRIGRQIVEQRRRRLTRRPPGEMARVVLDAVAVADLLDHLEIEHRPLMQPLRLEDLALRLELRRGSATSSSLIVSTARFVRSRGVTKCDFG